jgi:hypothetical protein
MSAAGRSFAGQAAVALLALSVLLGSCARSGGGNSAPRKNPLDGAVGATLPVAPQILVDQFGYRPGDDKVAVIRNPQVGFDADQKFSPGAAYEVRRAADGTTVFTGTLQAWNAGAVEESSGDDGWWFDFSSVKVPDRYFIYDTQRKLRSPTFSIGDDVYKKVLAAALRVFYYQRNGMAKTAPHAEPCWTDAAAYLGPDQDSQAHDVNDRDNPAKVRDLRGGWFDAGDTNKYVTFAAQPVHQLLTAYQDHPAAFTDDLNIPESGNGIPDVLDEVKWELDWLQRMQYPDGSVALKLGAIINVNPSPPSSDRTPRFYIPACSSATIAAAGMFAHAAYVFAGFPALSGYAEQLRSRASKAWSNYQSLPVKQADCDQGIVHASNADWSAEDQAGYAVEAAAYLFALTGEPAYQDYVKAHYKEAKPYHDSGWSRYRPDQGDSLLFYASLKNADGDTSRAILADKLADVNAATGIYGFSANDDLYRAYLNDAQYHWGSNNPRANYGSSNLDVIQHAIQVKDPQPYRQRALGMLHYFHGVNPLGMTYLTNMYSLGATRSANEIYHTWFQPKTKWSDAVTSECGPPPGYVPGGPNKNAAQDGVPATLIPPTGQPPQKSYKDWNVIWPDASFAITEPAIYFQSAYVKLLSAFVQ